MPSPEPTDDALMWEMRRGSQEAFDALFARYRQPVWAFLRRRTRDASHAEELAQDIFVAVLQGARRYERRGSVRSYLFGIAYNVLLADRRKSAARRVEPMEQEPARDDPDPASALWVRAALEKLDEDDRELLMLREFEQLSYEEIADVRQTPLNTVRSQLFRARAALKAALETRIPARTTHARR